MRIVFNNNVSLKFFSEALPYRAEFGFHASVKYDIKTPFYIPGVFASKIYSKYYDTINVVEYNKIPDGFTNFSTVKRSLIRVTAFLNEVDFRFVRYFTETLTGGETLNPFHAKTLSVFTDQPDTFFTYEKQDGQQYIRLDENVGS